MSLERVFCNPLSIGFLTFFLTAFNFFTPKNTPTKLEPQAAEKYADAEVYARIQAELNSYGIFMDEVQIFLRAFKVEETLELWARNKGDSQFIKIKNYSFCSTSGNPGPKRFKGDLQIPEGFYTINHLNPLSKFHLSLGVNYPNKSDIILSPFKNVGGSIYIHGGCATIGCIPITNPKIEELFVLATEHTRVNTEKIGIHIFPTVMDPYYLNPLISQYPNYQFFWRNLQAGYDWFEDYRTLPKVRIDNYGQYQVLLDY